MQHSFLEKGPLLLYSLLCLTSNNILCNFTHNIHHKISIATNCVRDQEIASGNLLVEFDHGVVVFDQKIIWSEG